MVSNTRLLAAGLTNQPGDNSNALRLVELADENIDDLNGKTILDYHKQATIQLSVMTASSRSSTQAANAFLSTMSDERERISGVNLDEEAVNLIRYQKAFAAASRMMSTMSDLLDMIMNI